MEIQYREILPGYIGFDCPRLRATLSAANCADNWRHRKCLSCNGCPIGAEHAGEKPAPPTRTRLPCVRCGRSDLRLLSRCLCISCYNRLREAVKMRNSKGTIPEIARRLHRAYAIVAHPSPHSALQAMAQRHDGHTYKFDTQNGLPAFSVLDKGSLWLSVVTTGAEEAGAMVERLLPDGAIEDMEVGPPLSERRSDNCQAS